MMKRRESPGGCFVCRLIARYAEYKCASCRYQVDEGKLKSTESLIEGHLGAGRLDDTAGPGAASGSTTSTAAESTTASATTTSTSTSSVTTESTSSTTSSAASATAAKATSATATLSVVLLGRGVVDSDRSSAELRAVHGLEGLGGLVDATELNVTEALGGTGVSVGREGDSLDVSKVTECLVDAVLVGVERQGAEEKGLGGVRLAVTKLVGPLFGHVVPGGSGVSVVDSDVSAIDLLAVHGLDGLGGSLDVGKVDVTETLGSLRVSVKHDSGRDDLAALLELGSEPVVVDVPRELTDKDVAVGLSLRLVRSGLLGGGLSLVLGLSLACNMISGYV